VIRRKALLVMENANKVNAKEDVYHVPIQIVLMKLKLSAKVNVWYAFNAYQNLVKRNVRLET